MTPRRPQARTEALLRARIQRVFRELPPALAGDEEAIHQVRVAGRRLRVALPLLVRKDRGRPLTRALRVLRQLTRAFGSGRDLDVHVGLLADRLTAVEVSSREQRQLLGRLRGARARGRRQLAEAVLDLDIDGLRRNLRRLLQQGAAESASVLARAAAARDAEASALLGGFSHAGDRYLPDALHALRRSIRRLRYTSELEDAIFGTDRRAPALWKRLQDGIGTLHDHHVLAAWLEGQARAAAVRGQAALSRVARRERSFFLAESLRLHTAFVQTRPADLTLRALDAMRGQVLNQRMRSGTTAGSRTDRLRSR